jgi:hypothetical protein
MAEANNRPARRWTSSIFAGKACAIFRDNFELIALPKVFWTCGPAGDKCHSEPKLPALHELPHKQGAMEAGTTATKTRSKINEYRAGAVRCEQRAKKTRNQADREWQTILARAYRILAEAET